MTCVFNVNLLVASTELNFLTGNGRNCTILDLCESMPCSQNCTASFNDFTCTCNDGYEINTTDTTQCDDIDECMQSPDPCDSTLNSMCVNAIGSFRYSDAKRTFTKLFKICIVLYFGLNALEN